MPINQDVVSLKMFRFYCSRLTNSASNNTWNIKEINKTKRLVALFQTQRFSQIENDFWYVDPHLNRLTFSKFTKSELLTFGIWGEMFFLHFCLCVSNVSKIEQSRTKISAIIRQNCFCFSYFLLSAIFFCYSFFLQ